MKLKFNTLLPVIVFVIAIFFATFHLTESPSVWYDEGWYTQAAMNLAEMGVDGLQVAPDNIYHASLLTTVGYPMIYPLGLWMNIFGVSVFSARFFMVIYLIGLLVGCYLLSRRLWGHGVAIAALTLVATLPTLYGNGKSVLGEVPGLLYLALFMFCFLIASSNTTRKYSWLMIAGIFAGLCIATKPLFLVLIPAIIIGACLEWKSKSFTFKEIMLVGIFTLIPIIVWFIVQFRGDTSIASVISYYANPYHITNLGQVILENFKHLFTNVGNLYLIGVMSIWFIAIGLRLKAKTRIASVEIIALTFCMLVILAFLRTAGWYRYLFPAQVLSLIFFPAAISTLLAQFSRFKMYTSKIITIIIIALSLFGVYQLIFDSWVAESYQSHKTEFWQEYFAQLSPTQSVFFYNTPEVVVFSHSRNYYQYISPAGGFVGQEQLYQLRDGLADIVIIESDTYITGDPLFEKYTVSTTTYKYTILERL